jgi:replicative DNA helicase
VQLLAHPPRALVDGQRNGPTGVVKLAFIREFTRFENLALGS